MTDARFAFRQQQKKTRLAGFSPSLEMNPSVRLGPSAGRQNPTCGTARKFHELASRTNIHEISHLRRAHASGTAVAKNLGVIESTSRPHYVQIFNVTP
jgi:hypothetical protein